MSLLDIGLADEYLVGSLINIVGWFSFLSCLFASRLWLLNLDDHLFGSLVLMQRYLRTFSRYQKGNQKPLIERGRQIMAKRKKNK